MKVRMGFVSNSSSSSFVMIGAKVKGFSFSQEEMIKAMERYGIKYSEKYPEDSFWDALHNEEFGFGYANERDLFGKIIAHGKDYGLEESQTCLEELADIEKEVKRNLKKFFGKDVEVQLWTGEMPC